MLWTETLRELIRSGHPVHRLKKVPQLLTARQWSLELFFLSQYSPELNADEIVRSVVIKGQVSGGIVVENKDTLRRLVCGVLMRLTRYSDKVKRLFHETHVDCLIQKRVGWLDAGVVN